MTGRTGSQAVAERLRVSVRAAGGNQKVASASGVHARTLGYHLAGREMKAGTALALSRTCGVSLSWLLTGEEEAAAPAPTNSARLDGQAGGTQGNLTMNTEESGRSEHAPAVESEARAELRSRFAAEAMKGLLAAHGQTGSEKEREAIAREAWAMAATMMRVGHR